MMDGNYYGAYFVPKIQLQLQASTFAFELPHSTVYIRLSLARLFRTSTFVLRLQLSILFLRSHSSVGIPPLLVACHTVQTSAYHDNASACSSSFACCILLRLSHAVRLSLAAYCFVFRMPHTASSFACHILLRLSLATYCFIFRLVECTPINVM